MKVLHVVNSLSVGGLEKFVVELSRQINQIDHTVACLTGKGEFFDDIHGETVFVGAPQKLSFRTVYKLHKIIYERNIDIVHTHNQGPQFYGALAAAMTRVPVIHTKHGQNVSNFHRRSYMDRFSSSLTRIIVTVSDDARDICINKLGISEKKIVTILNGVNTETFHRFINKIHCSSDKPFVIGTVARLAPEKNQACLLKACALLKHRKLNFIVRIVGNGPLRQELEQQARELGLSEHVVFEGIRRDIPVAMNSFDLFVLPSFTEGISLTLLEAMSCELPVVASAVGGNNEVVSAGQTGILVPSDDPDNLASAIEQFIIHPRTCISMGRAGRERVTSFFSIQSVCEKYYDLYKQLVN